MNEMPMTPMPEQPEEFGEGVRKKRNAGKILVYSFISILTLVILIAITVPVFFSAQSNAEEGSIQDEIRTAYAEGYQSATASLAPSAGSSSKSLDLPEIAPRIIKTGKATVELEKGTFQAGRDDVYSIIESYGGYVQTESVSRVEGHSSGTLVLRVPCDLFDQAFQELGELGEVLRLEVASQDVTQEYVDLEGRLRHLEAEEQFYLEMIGQAATIQDMMSIREKLAAVQLDKEQSMGRKLYLENQTAYSIINLTLQEEGGGVTVVGSGFWGRLGDAFVSFGRACREVAVGLAYALPYLVIVLALAFLIWRIGRRFGWILPLPRTEGQ